MIVDLTTVLQENLNDSVLPNIQISDLATLHSRLNDGLTEQRTLIRSLEKDLEAVEQLRLRMMGQELKVG